jgi:protein-tyrosine phosphatase
MIDLHAHILPALDDGPQSDAAALELARAAVAGGTTAIATTSHINRSFGLTADDLAGARAAFAAVLREAGVPLELLAGGEIAHTRLPRLSDEDLRAFALGGGPYVLLECPLAGSDDLAPLVDDLHARGFRVLLGHPERSPAFQREIGRLERLVDAGALAQVTTGAFTGDFGAIAQRTALDMTERGLVHVLASDTHDTLHRPPDLTAADAVLGTEQREWMAAAAPAAILAGEPLPDRPAHPAPR